jgi:hypothetical protein
LLGLGGGFYNDSDHERRPTELGILDKRQIERRRRRGGTVRFPFFDQNGEAVLWDRRRASGRRRSDKTHIWSRRDLPGFLFMGGLFVILLLGLAFVWTHRDTVLVEPQGRPPAEQSVYP